MARVVLAMSGGVDSSVAAHLLLEAGHEVVGVFMRHGEQSPAVCATTRDESRVVPLRRGPDVSRVVPDRGQQRVPTSGRGRDDAALVGRADPARASLRSLPIVTRLDHKQGCCTAADAEDARRVADRLAIPFYAIDLSAEFGQIMDYFAEEYARGRTPNPCVQCNNWIKFGKLFGYADSIGAEFVTTGHYARLEPRSDGPALLRGVDASKDQSYVLAGIGRGLLPRMLLPVGGYEKPRIREIAEMLGLNVAAKKDSQEICFVTQGRYDEFVKRRLSESRGVPPTADRGGELVTTTGQIVGHHDGIEGFTVGQRKGLGVALGKPAYVVSIDPESRRVVLGELEDLQRPTLTASGANWLVDLPIGGPVRCAAQIRYNSVAADATLTVQEGGRFAIEFDTPQRGVTPGQAVVCYAADEPQRVLGGGWID